MDHQLLGRSLALVPGCAYFGIYFQLYPEILFEWVHHVLSYNFIGSSGMLLWPFQD